MKKKDELLDFLASYGSTDLYNDLMGSNLYSFIERKRDELKKYPGYSDIEKTILHPKKAVQEAFKSDFKNQPDAYIKDQAEILELSEEDVRKYLNELDTEERHSKEIEARKKEVDQWPWYKKMLASDYAKQRYINEPEKSIFSDKGKTSDKLEDISDLAYGVVGAAGDALPKPFGTVVGPFVRSTRDITHKLVGSKYQKDWDEVAQSFLTDAAINAGVDYLPTRALSVIRKGTGNAKGILGKIGDKIEDAGDILKANEEQKALKKGMKDIPSVENNLPEFAEKSDKLTHASPQKWKRYFNSKEESLMKEDMLAARNLPADKKEDLLMQWKYISEKGDDIGNNIYDKETLKPVFQDDKYTPNMKKYLEDQAYSNEVKDKASLIFAGIGKGFKVAGEPVVKEISTAGTGRLGTKPKESEKSKFERWSKGYATVEEKKSPEYKVWNEENLKSILGVE